MAPAATIFDGHRLSADEQFTLLIGGGHPNIVDASVTRCVMSRTVNGLRCERRTWRHSHAHRRIRWSIDGPLPSGEVWLCVPTHPWTNRSGSVKLLSSILTVQVREYVNGRVFIMAGHSTTRWYRYRA
jgi:hypothetical protein